MPDPMDDAPAQDAGPIYSPIEPSHAASPHDRLRTLRSTCPVYQPMDDTWVVTLDGLARDVLRDHKTYSSYQNGTLVPMPDEELLLSQVDPPRHTVLRRFFQAVLSPRAIASVEPYVEELCASLLNEIEANESTDLMDAFISQVPSRVTMRILGMDGTRLDDLRRWVDDFFTHAIFGLDAVPSWPECKAYLHALIAERREATERPDDFLTTLIEADIEGDTLTDVDIRSVLFIFLSGGIETTAGLLGNLVRRLIENDLWEAVRNDRSLVQAAIEESLRLDPPVAWMLRTATAGHDLHGQQIREGDRLFVSFQGANRDEAQWTAPDEFRLDREAGRDHLAFGHGSHYCVGAPLARLEARIALNALLDRFAALALADEFRFEKHGSFMLHGPVHLPVTVVPSSA